MPVSSRSDLDLTTTALLHLLQLTNSALPVGAYSYSEGLETVIQSGAIATVTDLQHWLSQELSYGGIRLEAAVMLRACRAVQADQPAALEEWNQWFSAARDAEELRQQSWQMGRALTRLLADLDPALQPWLTACGTPCNFAIAFGVAAAFWQIPDRPALLGYLHSWASNLVNAGVKLVPLGQTAGQQLLHGLQANLTQTVQEVIQLQDDDLSNGGWGWAIASMQHEVLYSRLFRS